MANKEPKTVVGQVRKVLTGDGRKNPNSENVQGLETNKKKRIKRKKRTK